MKRAFLAALCGILPTLHAGVLIDFGMNGSTPSGHPDQRSTSTSPVWNNLAIGSASGGALNAGAPVLIAANGGLPAQSTAGLKDETGAASGWSIAFTSAGSGTNAIGTAGTGGNYSGTVAPAAAALFPVASATRDSLYVNTNGVVLTVSISGLHDAERYDLTAFSARNGTSTGGTWALSTGSAALARFQNAAGTFTGNTGQIISGGGTDAGLAIEWKSVAPAGGVIAFTMTAKSSHPVDLNALAIAPAAPLEEGGEVDVYLLGGQSNMQGLGKLAELTAEQKTPAQGVFYWTGSSFVPLVPGSTITAAAGEFGPEIAFAAEIAKRGRPAYLIKYSNSGKPLDAGWNDQTWIGDPSAPGRVNFHPGTDPADPNRGTLYRDHLLPRFQAGIAALAATGRTPVVKGLVWMQGEQDSKHAISAGRYAENLRRFRDRLAEDLGLAELPVVFGQVLPHEPAEPRFTHRAEIRAEMALADMDSGSPKSIPLCRMVATDGFPVYPSPDAVHYTTAGQWMLGQAFAISLGELLDGPPAPIHIAFHHDNDGHALETAMDPDHPPPHGSRVHPAAEPWFNLTRAFGSAGSLGTIPLPGGASLSGSYGYVGGKGTGYSRTNKDAVMMEGWLGLAGAESLTVSHLPAALAERYHVIVYGDADNNRRMNYTLAGTTKTIVDAGTFDGTYTEGANYVIFSGLSGASFTLTGNAATPRSAVSGISIVPGDPSLPPEIVSFTADDHYVGPGETVALSWSVTGADAVTISPGIGPVEAAGSVQVSPAATTVYTLTAVNGEGEKTATLRVGVGPERPNVVVFIVDDMGWQDTSVPFYHDSSGNPVVTGFNRRYRTPHMEALAASGRKFTSAYASSICSPSRISLMTGQSAARHRVTNWTLYPDVDQSDVSATLQSPPDWNINGLAPTSDTVSSRVWRTDETLPKLLQSSGYRTLHVGKAHFGADGLPGENPHAQGFDVNVAGHAAGGPGSFLGTAHYGSGIWQVPDLEDYHGSGTFLTEALTLEADKVLEEAVADGAPFFLHMAHYAIHVPLAMDARFEANYPGVNTTEKMYATMIEGMDKSLGDLRAKLEQLGVAENTLILFYSDNGGLSASARGTTPDGTGANTHNKPLRAGKGSAYEGGTRVPAMAAWAKADASNPFQQRLPIPAGSRDDRPFLIEDLFPTVLDIAAVEKPASIDGISVAPYLAGDPDYERPPSLLFHIPHIWSAGYIGMKQGYEMHSSLREGNWKIIHYYEDSRWELYDLAADLGETSNLATSRPDLVMKLGRKMIRMLEERHASYPVRRSNHQPKRPLLPALEEVDTDGDGLPDLVEDPNRNGLVDPGETDPDGADSDGDHTPDGAELRLGTDPLDATSSFRATVTHLAGNLRLTWPSLPGASFTIHGSSDLVDWTEVVAENLPAASAPARSTSHDVPATGTRFFRVSLDEP